MPKPLPEAEGRPHTVLGGKISSETGELYRQAAEFPGPSWPKVNGVDAPSQSSHWTTHGRPDVHADPHVHGYYFDSAQQQWMETGAQGFSW